MAEPSAADAIVIVFAALSGEEQRRVLTRLGELAGRGRRAFTARVATLNRDERLRG